MVGGHKQGRKPDSFRFHSTTEVYDHATESWSTMPALLQLPRASCLAAVLGHADAPGAQKRVLLVALLGFGWAASASLRSAVACWLSFSLAEFRHFVCSRQPFFSLTAALLGCGMLQGPRRWSSRAAGRGPSGTR